MKKRLRQVTPLRAGIVLGILYGFLGFIFAPFFLIAMFVGSQSGAPGAPLALICLFAIIALPIFYGVAGFIGGVIAAVLYNLVAKWTGGVEFETVDAPAS